MPAGVKKEVQLEIAHVLFIDVVGYSKLPVDQRRRLLDKQQRLRMSRLGISSSDSLTAGMACSLLSRVGLIAA
jgi:hypothetical protein